MQKIALDCRAERGSEVGLLQRDVREELFGTRKCIYTSVTLKRVNSCWVYQVRAGDRARGAHNVCFASEMYS